MIRNVDGSSRFDHIGGRRPENAHHLEIPHFLKKERSKKEKKNQRKQIPVLFLLVLLLQLQLKIYIESWQLNWKTPT